MKPGVTIVLDRPRTLRYGMNGLVKIEELTGKAISKMDLENISIKDLRSMIYAGLFHEDKTLTPERVADLIDEYSDLTGAAAKLGEAMTLAFSGGNTDSTPLGETAGSGRESS